MYIKNKSKWGHLDPQKKYASDSKKKFLTNARLDWGHFKRGQMEPNNRKGGGQPLPLCILHQEGGHENQTSQGVQGRQGLQVQAQAGAD